MISYPRLGQSVQVWYRAELCRIAPYHGRIGIVRIIAAGRKPRNHGVEIDGRIVVVPCGQLRKAGDAESPAVADASPRVRAWLLNLLQRGDRAGSVCLGDDDD